MKTKHLFWGFLFITLGTLILINNFSTLNIYWFNIWQFWPLFLILIGIALLIKNEIIRGVLISITAVILGISIFAAATSGWKFFRNDIVVDFNSDDFEDDNEENFKTNFFEEDFIDSIKYASLHFESGAGAFRISDTTDKLFEAVVRGYDNNYNLTRSYNGERVRLNFENDVDGHFIFRGKNKNRVNINLNPVPIWELEINVGAARTELDLHSYKVEDLDIDIGAASLKIILGNLVDSAHVDIEAGATSIEIAVPQDAGCELYAEVTLSSREFEGFKKIGDHHYRTENFYSSPKKIYLNVDTGLSSVKIKRYSKTAW